MTFAPSLLLMACSASKLQQAAPALDLYQGPMYRTFHANACANARPYVLILSAKHGFIAADVLIEPYDQQLTRARADQMLARLDQWMHVAVPPGAKTVLLAGGAEYRRVMRSAVTLLTRQGRLAPDVQVTETHGGIGYQRQQLGAYLRKLDEVGPVVGHHSNGTPLHRTMDGFRLGQSVDIVYKHLPAVAPRPAVIEELFQGPRGPTACVRMLDAKNSLCANTWVALRHLQAK